MLERLTLTHITASDTLCLFPVTYLSNHHKFAIIQKQTLKFMLLKLNTALL